jgi:hypothetical protein
MKTKNGVKVEMIENEEQFRREGAVMKLKEPKRIRPSAHAMEIGEGYLRSVVADHVKTDRTMGAYIIAEVPGEIWIARTIDDRVEISTLNEEQALAKAIYNTKVTQEAMSIITKEYNEEEAFMWFAELLDSFVSEYKPGGVMFTDRFVVSGTPENPIIDVRTYTPMLENMKTLGGIQ